MALKNDKQLQMRVDDAFLQKIDEWRHAHKIPTRADAIRKLVEAGMVIPKLADELIEAMPTDLLALGVARQLQIALQKHFEGMQSAAESQIRDLLNRVMHGQQVDNDELVEILEFIKAGSTDLQPGETLLSKAAQMREWRSDWEAKHLLMPDSSPTKDFYSFDILGLEAEAANGFAREVERGDIDKAFLYGWASSIFFGDEMYNAHGRLIASSLQRRSIKDRLFRDSLMKYLALQEDMFSNWGNDLLEDFLSFLRTDAGKLYAIANESVGRTFRGQSPGWIDRK